MQNFFIFTKITTRGGEKITKDVSQWNKHFHLDKYESIAKMTLATIEKHGDRICQRWWADEECKMVNSITYLELKEKLKNVLGGLLSLGYKKDDHIALCSETRAEWVWSDLGIQCLGASTTAIYPSLKPKEIEYILNDSESIAIFLDEHEVLEKILEIFEQIPQLQHIFIFETLEKSDLEKHPHFDELETKFALSKKLMTLSHLMDLGTEYNTTHPDAFWECVEAVTEDTLASIIYTSGTTGIPKGVMLTNKNFLSMSYMAVSIVATLIPGDLKSWEMNFLSILPLSHSFGRGCDEYCVIYAGASMNYSGGFNPAKVRRSFEAFQPQILLAVPYFFQKIQNLVNDEVAAMPPKIQNIFKKAMVIGYAYHHNIQEGRKNSLGLKFKYATLRKLVAKVVRKKLGGKLIAMINGSAAISIDLMIFFHIFDVELVQGYGLTETSPVTHINRTWYNSDFRPDFDKKLELQPRLKSIGPPINVPGSPYEPILQKKSEFGELLLKGPQVMQGYWKKPENTASAIDKDGWFHTGDLCEIDENGYVYITGRSKLVIKLKTAKMISPAAVEQLIIPTSKIVAQFVLAGDDSRKYVTAFVVPYQEPLREYADAHGIEYASWKDLIHNSKILGLIRDDILELTKDVSDYARPKKFAISSKAFSAEEEYITPSFKFKRKKLFEDYGYVLDNLYTHEDEFLIIEDRMTDFYDQSMIIG